MDLSIERKALGEMVLSKTISIVESYLDTKLASE
jgi:hypothetical protein